MYERGFNGEKECLNLTKKIVKILKPKKGNTISNLYKSIS